MTDRSILYFLLGKFVAIEEIERLIDWNLFLSLEDDIAQLARYIEPTQKNFDTYSIELARVLLAACAEVDVTAKQLCTRLNTRNAESINAYRETITAAYPQIGDCTVSVPRFGLTLKPWINWEQNQKPESGGAVIQISSIRGIHISQMPI